MDVHLDLNNEIPKRYHTILICDDEPELLDLYGAMLSEEYKIVKACSGKDCIERYTEIKDKDKEPCIILIDFRLGDTTGDKVANEIKKINNAKVILISAYEIDYDLIKRLKAEGTIVEFLLKPFTLITLKDTLARIISASGSKL
jgi:CheY-like chemotaxis protein